MPARLCLSSYLAWPIASCESAVSQYLLNEIIIRASVWAYILRSTSITNHHHSSRPPERPSSAPTTRPRPLHSDAPAGITQWGSSQALGLPLQLNPWHHARGPPVLNPMPFTYSPLRRREAASSRKGRSGFMASGLANPCLSDIPASRRPLAARSLVHGSHWKPTQLIQCIDERSSHGL